MLVSWPQWSPAIFRLTGEATLFAVVHWSELNRDPVSVRKLDLESTILDGAKH